MSKKKDDQPVINIKCDGYEITLEDGKLVVVSPVPVEVKSAPKISNGVDELVSKADLDAANMRMGRKWQKGRFYENQGIYLGEYKLKSPNDASLCRVFHAFAAKEDFPHCLEGDASGDLVSANNLMNLNDKLSKLRGQQQDTIFDNSGYRNIGGATIEYNPVPRVHGRSVMALHDFVYHHGEHKGLWELVESGGYKGEWFVPTYDILANVLYSNKDRGDMKNSFNDVANPFANHIYLSCSKDRGDSGYHSHDFANNEKCTLEGSQATGSARLVRLVPVS